jgi:hypothetical protein
MTGIELASVQGRGRLRLEAIPAELRTEPRGGAKLP